MARRSHDEDHGRLLLRSLSHSRPRGWIRNRPDPPQHGPRPDYHLVAAVRPVWSEPDPDHEGGDVHRERTGLGFRTPQDHVPAYPAERPPARPRPAETELACRMPSPFATFTSSSTRAGESTRR